MATYALNDTYALSPTMFNNLIMGITNLNAGPIRATVNEKLNWQILGAAVVPDAHVPATKVPNIHQWMGKQRDHDLGKFESSQVLI